MGAHELTANVYPCIPERSVSRATLSAHMEVSSVSTGPAKCSRTPSFGPEDHWVLRGACLQVDVWQMAGARPFEHLFHEVSCSLLVSKYQWARITSVLNAPIHNIFGPPARSGSPLCFPPGSARPDPPSAWPLSMHVIVAKGWSEDWG
jgi:hypothetical protein